VLFYPFRRFFDNRLLSTTGVRAGANPIGSSMVPVFDVPRHGPEEHLLRVYARWSPVQPRPMPTGFGIGGGRVFAFVHE